MTGPSPPRRRPTSRRCRRPPNGLATITGLTPGRYTARAEFQGFYPGVLKEVRVRQGDNRHIIVLLVENFAETVDVKQDAQAGAADRRSDAFGSVLTREQMDALSDDPDEMQRQLMDMAGPGAIMRIDSFEGGRLPPKSQIKSIRVTRDQFAAENHSADSFFIEVITQPGHRADSHGRQLRLAQQRDERAQRLHADERARSRISSTASTSAAG